MQWITVNNTSIVRYRATKSEASTVNVEDSKISPPSSHVIMLVEGAVPLIVMKGLSAGTTIFSLFKQRKEKKQVQIFKTWKLHFSYLHLAGQVCTNLYVPGLTQMKTSSLLLDGTASMASCIFLKSPLPNWSTLKRMAVDVSVEFEMAVAIAMKEEKTNATKGMLTLL